MNTAILLQKRRKAARDIPRIEEILRGSIVVVKRYCGKVNCRCQKGHKHRSLYISQSNNGQSRLAYIPRALEERARQLTRNYQALKSVMEDISRVNMRLVTTFSGSKVT